MQNLVDDLHKETNEQKAEISHLEQKIVILQRDSRKGSIERNNLIRTNSAKKLKID